MSEIEEKRRLVPNGYSLLENPNDILLENDICMLYDMTPVPQGQVGSLVAWRVIAECGIGIAISYWKDSYLFARKVI